MKTRQKNKNYTNVFFFLVSQPQLAFTPKVALGEAPTGGYNNGGKFRVTSVSLKLILLIVSKELLSQGYSDLSDWCFLHFVLSLPLRHQGALCNGVVSRSAHGNPNGLLITDKSHSFASDFYEICTF